jgi:hypothetical protein
MWIFYLILGLWASSVVLEFLLAETDAGEADCSVPGSAAATKADRLTRHHTQRGNRVRGVSPGGGFSSAAAQGSDELEAP